MRGNFPVPVGVARYEEARANRRRNARSPTGKAGHDNAPTLPLGPGWHQSGSGLDAGRVWTKLATVLLASLLSFFIPGERPLLDQGQNASPGSLLLLRIM